MIKQRMVLRFLLIFFTTYAILMLTQPAKDRYAKVFCYFGNKLFHDIKDNGITVLEPQKGKYNIRLLITSTSFIKNDNIVWNKYSRSSDHIGYWHTAFLLSLIIATPMFWKRKIVALGSGFFIFICIAMLRLRVIISYCYAITPALGLYQDPSEKTSAIFWNTYFGTAFSIFYSVAVLIWLMLCIGKNEWRQLNGVFTAQITKGQQPVKSVKKEKR